MRLPTRSDGLCIDGKCRLITTLSMANQNDYAASGAAPAVSYWGQVQVCHKQSNFILKHPFMRPFYALSIKV